MLVKKNNKREYAKKLSKRIMLGAMTAGMMLGVGAQLNNVKPAHAATVVSESEWDKTTPGNSPEDKREDAEQDERGTKLDEWEMGDNDPTTQRERAEDAKIDEANDKAEHADDKSDDTADDITKNADHNVERGEKSAEHEIAKEDAAQDDYGPSKRTHKSHKREVSPKVAMERANKRMQKADQRRNRKSRHGNRSYVQVSRKHGRKNRIRRYMNQYSGMSRHARNHALRTYKYELKVVNKHYNYGHHKLSKTYNALHQYLSAKISALKALNK